MYVCSTTIMVFFLMYSLIMCKYAVYILIQPLLYRQEPPEKVETEEEAKRREEWRKKKKYKARKQNVDDKPWVLKEKKKDGAM